MKSLLVVVGLGLALPLSLFACGNSPLKGIEQLKDKVCACKDKACVDKIQAEAEQLQSELTKLTSEEQRKTIEIAQEMMACMAKHSN